MINPILLKGTDKLTLEEIIESFSADQPAPEPFRKDFGSDCRSMIVKENGNLIYGNSENQAVIVNPTTGSSTILINFASRITRISECKEKEDWYFGADGDGNIKVFEKDKAHHEHKLKLKILDIVHSESGSYFATQGTIIERVNFDDNS